LLEKIISGGQTGVDRAALDAAIANHFTCGGFCPQGRVAEDGIIAAKYPLEELSSKSYAKRTLENVLSADATLIIYCNTLKGGSALTSSLCQQHEKLVLLFDAMEGDTTKLANKAFQFIQQNSVSVLNIAGPRKSQWPGGYQFTYQCMEELIRRY